MAESPLKKAAPASFAAGAVYLVASGDLRPAANEQGWPAQKQLEAAIGAALARVSGGATKLVRAHPDGDAPAAQQSGSHGFLRSQRDGLTCFAGTITSFFVFSFFTGFSSFPGAKAFTQSVC